MLEFGKIFIENFSSHANIFESSLQNEQLRNSSKKAAEKIAQNLRFGGKILICGNGGSAADANHLAAEFINRYKKDRAPLPAISLSANTSNITSIANDYSFNGVFSKQIHAFGKKEDILIAISTSGKSTNIIEALRAAKEKKVFSILFTGNSKTDATKLADIVIAVPSNETARIQEIHLLLYHCICDFVEREMFEK